MHHKNSLLLKPFYFSKYISEVSSQFSFGRTSIYLLILKIFVSIIYLFV